MIIKDEEKRCSKCREVKLKSAFSIDNSRNCGLHPQCKQCKNLNYQNNRKKILAKYKKYYEKNKDRINMSSNLYQKEYRKKHKEERKVWLKIYNKENREKINHYKSKWIAEKRKTSIKHKLSSNISNLVRITLKEGKGGQSWRRILGYTVIELIKHLNKTMPKGYCWQDYLDGKLHVDHIIPVSVHNFETIDDVDFKKCWILKNLQLLPCRKNIEKSNKLEKPFQPSFAFR